jgi:hypothetical protein
MPLEDFIISVLCCVEQMWHESPAPSRLRERGAPPKLSDSEVLTMEIVGEFLDRPCKDARAIRYGSTNLEVLSVALAILVSGPGFTEHLCPTGSKSLVYQTALASTTRSKLGCL